MEYEQIAAFAVIAGMMAGFVWGRLRYDLVAVVALLAALATGIVPAEDAFSGFSDDIVIIVAGALVTSAAISKSGLADALVKRLVAHLPTVSRQIAVLAGTVMVMSGFVKNIGALSMLIPPTFQIARKTGTPVSRLLMPMSFASLLGGLVTLVGTSPNIIVSGLREQISGEPFRMFDFAPVGIPVALAGLVFLVVGHRLLPMRKGMATGDGPVNVKGYTTEAVVPADAAVVGRPVAEIGTLSDGDVQVTALLRGENRRFRDPVGQIIRPDDRLLLEGESKDLEQLVAVAGLRIARASERNPVNDPEDEVGVMEAVVTADSLMIDWTAEKLRLADRFDATLVAVGRAGQRVSRSLKSFRFRAGDVVVLQGNLNRLPDTLRRLGCLPLAGSDVGIGRPRQRYVPAIALAVAMILMALQIIPVAVAFFGAAAAVVLLGTLTTREAYDALEPPLLVTLACLIPVSDAMRTTGATEVIAGWLAALTSAVPPVGALVVVMVVAMAVTPFLNNAATVLVAGPIAAGLAIQLGLSPDPFLMAVAVGAASDFLTPIGHQCNMLVMGPGGYRFGDYWRLGLPLSVLVVALGVPLIAIVWPLAP